jgi:hypothetical protein
MALLQKPGFRPSYKRAKEKSAKAVKAVKKKRQKEA